MSSEQKFDVDRVIADLKSATTKQPGTEIDLKDSAVIELCVRARKILLSQPCLLRLEAPIIVCGDVHGQYYDLLRIFESGGFPPLSNYIFLGDYIDRGRQGVETLTLLLAYKVKYQNNFFLLRGNHECASISRIYGFYDECKRRFKHARVWKNYCDVFNCLPLAATIDEKIFCVHGGLSPELSTIEQIQKINRPTDVPDIGLVCDLLWADPTRFCKGWQDSDRGVSYLFGNDVVKRFCKKEKIDLVIRAHQVVEDGYEFFAKRQLCTIFSAPKYCGEFDNAAAILKIDENLLCSFEVFKPSGT